MATTKNRKEYQVGGWRYFVEQHFESVKNEWMWRYGYMVDAGPIHYGYILKDGLRSRPNIKRLFGE